MENKLNIRAFQLASLLMAVTFLAHLFLGGPELYSPLRVSDAAEELKSVFSVVWHFVSLQLFLMTAALWWLARHRNNALYWFVLLAVSGFAILFIAYGFIDLGSIWPMPQWIAFGAVAALMLFGWHRR